MLQPFVASARFEADWRFHRRCAALRIGLLAALLAALCAPSLALAIALQSIYAQLHAKVSTVALLCVAAAGPRRPSAALVAAARAAATDCVAGLCAFGACASLLHALPVLVCGQYPLFQQNLTLILHLSAFPPHPLSLPPHPLPTFLSPPSDLVHSATSQFNDKPDRLCVLLRCMHCLVRSIGCSLCRRCWRYTVWRAGAWRRCASGCGVLSAEAS